MSEWREGVFSLAGKLSEVQVQNLRQVATVLR